jgi:hypothetical protein
MKTILFHTATVYLLATAISFAVAALIKAIERSLRQPAPNRDRQH